MKNCYQFRDLNVLEHGYSVRNKYRILLEQIQNSDSSLPDYIIKNKDFILENQYLPEILEAYQIYHDCGKPYCEVIDEHGKKHFPNHAKMSYQIYAKYFYPDKLILKFILSDMIFHAGTMEEIENFLSIQKDKKFVVSLWLTNYAELLANKEMFDSSGDISFKIKQKKLERCFKKILARFDVENVMCGTKKLYTS